jgi:hypothetical protein
MTLRPFARASLVKVSCCLTVALFLAPQPALDPTTAAFKAAVNPILAKLQEEVQGAKKLFMADIQAFEVAIKGGLPASANAQVLFDACVALQTSVASAGNTALGEIFQAAQDALAALAGGAPLNGVYPDDFYSGTGGQWDKARDSVKSKVEKIYPPLQGRLRKAASLAAGKGISLTLRLTPPALQQNWFVSEDDGTNFTNQFVIDTIVSVNRTALPEDGEVWVAGVGAAYFGTITVRVLGPEDDTVTTTAANFRWSAHANQGGTLFKKGNYLVNVRLDITSPGDVAVFSIR